MAKEKTSVYLTKREKQLIEFIREKLPFGRCLLVTHNGEPQRVEDPKKIKFFGNGNGEPLDRCFGKDI